MTMARAANYVRPCAGALLSCVLTGCMPQVLHGPRVEPGSTALLNLSAGANLPLDEEDFADEAVVFAPSLYFGGRHGIVGGEGKAAFSIGGQLSGLGVFLIGEPNALEILAAGSYLDLYVQPRRYEVADHEFGVGTLVSTALLTPYVQYGRTGSSGNSWFTTQSVVVSTRAEDRLMVWMPSVGWRTLKSESGRAVTFNAGAGIGKLESRTITLFLMSANVEFGLRRVK